MKQNLINDAFNIIQQRKRNAIENYEEKTKNIKMSKEYQLLEKKYTTIMIYNAKKIADGKNVDQSEEKSLKNKLDKLLNFETPKFYCNLCKDEGYVNGTRCKCLNQVISNLLLKNSGFEKLENFDEAIKTSGDLALLYKKMQAWCNGDFKKTIIYISGAPGVGKTYLTRCMANELIKRGLIVKMSTAFNMSLDFKEFTKTNNNDLLNQYINCNVLFIDDLGTEPMFKETLTHFFYLIINERKMKKLPTVITTNLTLSDLKETYDTRIYSRIVDRNTSITVFLSGNDRRIKNH